MRALKSTNIATSSEATQNLATSVLQSVTTLNAAGYYKYSKDIINQAMTAIKSSSAYLAGDPEALAAYAQLEELLQQTNEQDPVFTASAAAYKDRISSLYSSANQVAQQYMDQLRGTDVNKSASAAKSMADSVITSVNALNAIAAYNESGEILEQAIALIEISTAYQANNPISVAALNRLKTLLNQTMSMNPVIRASAAALPPPPPTTSKGECAVIVQINPTDIITYKTLIENAAGSTIVRAYDNANKAVAVQSGGGLSQTSTLPKITLVFNDTIDINNFNRMVAADSTLRTIMYVSDTLLRIVPREPTTTTTTTPTTTTTTPTTTTPTTTTTTTPMTNTQQMAPYPPGSWGSPGGPSSWGPPGGPSSWGPPGGPSSWGSPAPTQNTEQQSMIQLFTQQLMMQQLLMQQQMLKAQGITFGDSSQKDTISPPEKPYITENTDLTAAPPEEQPYKTAPLNKGISDESLEHSYSDKIKSMYNNIVPVVNELIKIGSIDSAKNIIHTVLSQVEDEAAHQPGSQDANNVLNKLRTASESLTNIILHDDT